tara:strand:- start:122 stop:1177 length:1056 start_codon:yes stop_codon:yes gene_type:complete
MNQTKKLIEVKSMYSVLSSKNKTSYVMNDCDLIINRGSAIGIVGESGSGKTQLLKTITGTQEMIPGIVNGSITYYIDNEKKSMYSKKNGKYILSKHHKEIKKNLIGFIPQDPRSFLNPFWTLEELFSQTYKLKENRKITLHKFMEKYLKQAGIVNSKNPVEDFIHKYPDKLSGGQAQRVMIAFVLSKEPELIIADESTTGLDVTNQKIVIDTFSKIRKENPNITMIFISHDFGFLSHVVEEYYVIYGGFICEHITDKKQFYKENELHPYTRDLILSLKNKAKASKIDHDQISTSLLTKPLSGCPYFNSKCLDENCNEEHHFHNRIPPIFDHSGNSLNVDLNEKWKRSINVK